MDTSKIIKGVVGGGRYTVTAPIVKEDYGLYLKIEGLELPSTYEVDFSNSEHNGTAVTMIGNSDGVLIPHQFIDSGKDIFAFLYHVGEDYGRTIFKFRIPNKLRPDRTNEEPTPEEQSVIDQAISALNTAVEQTAQDKADADVSAQSASADAERAEEARTDAQNYATQAEQSATDAHESASQASASATASAQSASQAEQIKSDVEDLVDDAQGYANSAQQSASQASASEQGCARAVLDAATAAAIARARADEASGYAQTASASAQTASQKASEASTSASTASAKATESAQSASQALTYKTDAETAKTASQTAQGLAEEARDDSEQIKSDVQDLADGIDTRLVDVEDGILKAFPTDTASGAVASFTDGADGLPLKSLVVDINPVQDTSSGDPSPENICPISGWTQVNVEQSGKNIAHLTHGTQVPSINTGQMVNASGWSSDYIKINNNLQYVASCNELANAYILFYGKSKNYLGSVSYSTPRLYVLSNYANFSQTAYVKIRGDGTQSTPVKIQLELGSTATPYEPYTGRSITIDLGQTVYGGQLDVLTGELVIKWVSITSATADLSVTNIGTVKRVTWNLIKLNMLADKSLRRSSMSNVASWLESYNSDTVHFYVDSNGTYMHVYVPVDYDVANIQSVIPLATPLTIQLTPHEVNSLYGQNNIFADTGDTACEYRADTTLYIQRLTEPDADMIADSNIVSGQYFMIGNNLYKATANIASGGQIVVGTNCTRVSLAQALNEINA